jgi:hypothetical protein
MDCSIHEDAQLELRTASKDERRAWRPAVRQTYRAGSLTKATLLSPAFEASASISAT